jgi:hypothetical protein
MSMFRASVCPKNYRKKTESEREKRRTNKDNNEIFYGKQPSFYLPEKISY